jgi:hypothetical protein
MGRTVIVSEETLRALLTANAGLAAWYHEFVRASREQTPVMTPGDASRKAFLDRLALELPEVAPVARAIGVPPVYVPPPIAFAPTAPAPEHATAHEPQPAAAQPASDDASKPPMVNPRLVKY